MNSHAGHEEGIKIITLAQVLIEVEKNGRVCPQPMRWNELYNILPDCRRKGGGWEPALPLILAAWDTPISLKKLRLREHLEWAESHGCLQQVYDFIVGLSEEDWYHV